jgi:hypothetical protein
MNESLHMELAEWKQSITDGKNVQSAYELPKEICVQSATEVCGTARVGYKGGTEWWKEGVRLAAEAKKEAYLKWVTAKKQSEKKSMYEMYKRDMWLKSV